MKLGIFGGTFDPPHLGHLIVAESVRTSLRLEKVVFIPCNSPPHKRGQPILEASHRLEMVKLAIADNPYFEVSEVEIRRGGVSYTVDTLREIKAHRPGDRLVLLLGMDNLDDFDTWKEPDGVTSLAEVVIMTRAGV